MRTVFLAIALAGLAGDPAGAESLFPAPWCEAAALVRSLLPAPPTRDWEVIAPPPGIDRQMAVVPAPGGAMSVIRPPADPGQR